MQKRHNSRSQMTNVMPYFLATIVCLNLLSDKGCAARWETCQMDIPYNCATSNLQSCNNICGGAVGGNLLIEAHCRRRGGSRGAAGFYCDCLFSCPPRRLKPDQENAIAPPSIAPSYE